ncbi:MAG: hypothetical protein Q4Q53_07390 [Methanocorpusculum sp.]|nr:hypothetical protein [Methanocorpusculum sp.]
MTEVIAEFKRDALTKGARVPYRYPPEHPVWEESWEEGCDIGESNVNTNTTSLLENFMATKYNMRYSAASDKRCFLLSKKYR